MFITYDKNLSHFKNRPPDDATKPQNHAIRICLGKKEFYGSTSTNYKELKVLPDRYLYRQFSIIFITGKITTKPVNKRENRANDMYVSYTKNNIFFVRRLILMLCHFI